MTEAENLEWEGWEAYRRGASLFSCPYLGGTAEWWKDGWLAAERAAHLEALATAEEV